MRGGMQYQLVVPFTGWVKKLVIANLVMWIGGVIILQELILGEPVLFQWFGVVPGKVITSFWIWQPFTYMFLHSASIFHVLFNMLMLWWLGSDLEARWGGKFFLTYYAVCAVGAAFIYVLGVLVHYLITGNVFQMGVPMVGASGAVFGLILAYGILFGERIIYFMMVFPMKAKWFVVILAGIEVITLLNQGPGHRVANLAHLGGLVTGFMFLIGYTRFKSGKARRKTRRYGRKLRLVVDNERAEVTEEDNKPPRYWN